MMGLGNTERAKATAAATKTITSLCPCCVIHHTRTNGTSLLQLSVYGGWPRSHFSYSNTDEGAPHLAFEMWAFSEASFLRVVVHRDSISTVPLSPVG